MIREITSADLARLAAQEQPLLVAFFKARCPWCERLEPELERLADDWAGRLEVVKLGVDAAPELLADYRLRGAPTLVLLNRGQRLGRKQGFQRVQQLQAFLNYHLCAD